MVNTTLTSSWLIGGWVVAMTIIVAVSMSMGANLSTTAMFLALGIAPGVVIALLARSAPSPSVAEILHATETTDRRS